MSVFIFGLAAFSLGFAFAWQAKPRTRNYIARRDPKTGRFQRIGISL